MANGLAFDNYQLPITYFHGYNKHKSPLPSAFCYVYQEKCPLACLRESIAVNGVMV